MEQYIAVDLEMTGLRTRQDRIVEIGAVRICGDALGDCFQTLVNPHRKLGEQLVALTGITDEMVSDASDAKDALREFLRFAKDLPLVGHNIIFDYGFLKQCAANEGIAFERNAVDTLKIARKLPGQPEKKSLDSLCDHYRIEREHAHRALADARASAELFLLLRRRYGAIAPDLFVPQPLCYPVKKQGPATPAQKRDLNHLIICHRIEWSVDIDSLTRNEASRLINRIYAAYGKGQKKEEPEYVSEFKEETDFDRSGRDRGDRGDGGDRNRIGIDIGESKASLSEVEEMLSGKESGR